MSINVIQSPDRLGIQWSRLKSRSEFPSHMQPQLRILDLNRIIQFEDGVCIRRTATGFQMGTILPDCA
jgi:hypothetical protein